MGFGNIAFERAALESTYEGLCTVTEFLSAKDPVTKVTKQQEVQVLVNEPCALSQTSSPGVLKTDVDNTTDFTAKLFISPDVTIRPGCEINVVQNGMDCLFQQVGTSFRYATHQEILLKQIDRA